jgi:predicted membrane protein
MMRGAMLLRLMLVLGLLMANLAVWRVNEVNAARSSLECVNKIDTGWTCQFTCSINCCGIGGGTPCDE